MNWLQSFGQYKPIVNPHVVPKLKNGVLKLHLNTETLVCTREQAIIWALFDGGISNLRAILYQLSTIEEFQENNDLAGLLQRTVEHFTNKSLISLFDGLVVEQPIDVTPYSHFVTTRGGLYGINTERFERLDTGMFFGACVNEDNQLLVYEFPHLMSSQWRNTFSNAKKVISNEGCIHRYSISKGQFQKELMVTKQLANNCHHLVYDYKQIFAVDTEGQRILKVSEKGDLQIIEVLDTDTYHHINSLAKLEGGWMLMKSIDCSSELGSGIAVFDDDWNLTNSIELQGERAHDLLIQSGSTIKEFSFWYCDSGHNRIRKYPSECSVEVPPGIGGNNTTRGLSESENHWIVGNGRYGRYHAHINHSRLRGAVSYINKKTDAVDHRIPMPEAPCCIVKNPEFFPSLR